LLIQDGGISCIIYEEKKDGISIRLASCKAEREKKLDSVRVERFYDEFEPQQNPRERY
jgi:hypothetical protein